MYTKKLINQRFIDSVNWLLSQEKYGNKAAIAEKIKVKPPKLSEILNGRMTVQVEDLAIFCDSYPVNSFWLLTGKGEMDIAQRNLQELNSVDFDPQLALKLISAQEEIIQCKNKILELEELLRGNAAAS